MGSIISGALGFMGQRQTNEMQQEDFLSNQQFNAQQAELNRQFQAGQQTSAEDWMAQMSDTAMQRRVADLKAAGLNPMLAIGQGGASTPGISAPGGSTAQSSAIPNVQSPVQAGMQSAQAAAQIKLAQEQASKTHSETPTPRLAPTLDPKTGELTVPNPDDAGHELGNANLNSIIANTGVSNQQALQVKAATDYIGSQIKNTDANTALTNIQARLEGLSSDILQATKQSIIDQATASGVEAKNVVNLLKDPTWGPIISTIDRLLKPAASALGAVAPFIK